MSTPPRFVRACARRAERHRLATGGRATVDLPLPDGSSLSLDLLDVSESGVCFGLEPRCPVPRIGATIDPVTLRACDRTILGRLRIVHVTEEFSAGTVCGAEFEPATTADREELAALIGKLSARPSADE